jgi:hypothetical protein
VLFGSLEMVFFFFAAEAAFLMFRRAAAFCFAVAMEPSLIVLVLIQESE